MRDEIFRELIALLNQPPSDFRQLQISKILEAIGTNLDEQTDQQLSHILISACYNNDITIVQMLLNTEVNPNQFGSNVFDRAENKITPLYISAKLGLVDIVILLLHHPRIDVNQGAIDDDDEDDENVITPIYVSSANGHTVVVKKLIDAGANPNSEKEQDYSPLHIATINGHVDTAEALLKAGAHVDARDEFNSTPLLLVIEEFDYDDDCGYQQMLDIIRLLIYYGADPIAKNYRDNTPLEIAYSNSDQKIKSLLLQAITSRALRSIRPEIAIVLYSELRSFLPTLFKTTRSISPTSFLSQEDHTPPSKRRKEGNDSQETQQVDTKKFSASRF